MRTVAELVHKGLIDFDGDRYSLPLPGAPRAGYAGPAAVLAILEQGAADLGTIAAVLKLPRRMVWATLTKLARRRRIKRMRSGRYRLPDGPIAGGWDVLPDGTAYLEAVAQ